MEWSVEVFLGLDQELFRIVELFGRSPLIEFWRQQVHRGLVARSLVIFDSRGGFCRFHVDAVSVR